MNVSIVGIYAKGVDPLVGHARHVSVQQVQRADSDGEQREALEKLEGCDQQEAARM